MANSKEKKIENTLKFYFMCNRLKNILRTGWVNWNLERDRVESIAEHVYGTEALAIAMNDQFGYNLDIMKVVFLLSIHEIGETIIGDRTQFDISKEEKIKIERDAVHKFLKDMISKKELEKYFIEFDDHFTPEGFFAYQCDKLECDIQAFLYGIEGCFNTKDPENNPAMKNKLVTDLLDEGMSIHEMWLRFGQSKYPYDENFMAVSKYLLEGKIDKLGGIKDGKWEPKEGK